MFYLNNVLTVTDEEIDEYLEDGYTIIEIFYDDEGNRQWKIGELTINEED